MAKASASLGALIEADPTDAVTNLPENPTWVTTSKKYLQLTKPGIVLGNLVSVIGGFLLASRGHFDAGLFALATAGVSLIVASGCVFNNYIDRDIDLLMRRTQKRVLARGLVPVPVALTYAGLLGLGGLYLLYRANLLSALLGVAGFAIYVGVYSLYLKRRSQWQTAIGSLSGAMPPVIGYCVVSGQFDLAAFLLLLIFSLWQMPHSYAIAIVYRDDYANAGIPVLPVKRGIETARKHILFYIPIFTAAALMLWVEGYVGRAYFAVIALLGLGWLGMGLFGARVASDRKWAYKMFFFSIVGVMILSLMMAIDYR